MGEEWNNKGKQLLTASGRVYGPNWRVGLG